MFFRPYADDFIKTLLSTFPDQVKVVLAANIPRIDMIKLLNSISSHKKLSFLAPQQSEPLLNSKKRLLLNPNKPVNHECKNFYEILDSRFYNEEGKLDLKVVFGDFLNSKS